MLNYQIHENGWTVIVEGFDLRQATQSQANTIAKLLATNTVVVVRGQTLTPQDEIDFCSKIGKVEDWTERIAQFDPLKGFLVKDGDNKVIRVTGELDEHGRPGLFGHVSDLDWHANQTANEWRQPIVWLYGVKGTAGSRTSWLNNIASYNDLDQADKDYYKTIRMINGYKQGA
jgi:alpha-ketoglutarate-dependent taurine dioxygenase